MLGRFPFKQALHAAGGGIAWGIHRVDVCLRQTWSAHRGAQEASVGDQGLATR
jgi:hypothetical protein